MGGRPGIPVVGLVTRDETLRQEVLAALSPDCAVVCLDPSRQDAPVPEPPLVLVVDADCLGDATAAGRNHWRAGAVLLVAQEAHLQPAVGPRIPWHDFVLRPCRAAELRTRVHRLLEEASQEVPQRITCGPIEIDLVCREVTIRGQAVHLTNREFSLLQALARHLGQPVSRQDLMDAVWGTDYEGGSNVVDVFIRSLRQKLEPVPTRPRYILTVRGVGYRLVPGVSGEDGHAARAGPRVAGRVRHRPGLAPAALSTVT